MFQFMMHPKAKQAALIKTRFGRYSWGHYALPMAAVTLGLSLLAGQQLLRSQSSQEITPPPQTVELIPPVAAGQQQPWERLAAQPTPSSLPPDLFSRSGSLAAMPPAASPRRQTAPSPTAAVAPPRQVPVAVQPTQGRSPEIRVAIARREPGLPIGTSTSGYLVDDQGQALKTLTANQALPIQPNSQGMAIAASQLPTSVWVQPSAGGLVYVDGRWYRGKVRLINEGGSLTAVNHVDLEQYVTSVVGAEVYPSWPMAALKAQAIAARSYALAQSFRPASRFFDLGNDQRWQVYQGIEDEWNTTQQAVNATRGIVLSQDGNVLVSMYAATDEIVRDVFGGRGMSQNGAFRLAQQGFDYLQILGTYYPGAGLSQIRLQS